MNDPTYLISKENLEVQLDFFWKCKNFFFQILPRRWGAMLIVRRKNVRKFFLFQVKWDFLNLAT